MNVASNINLGDVATNAAEAIGWSDQYIDELLSAITWVTTQGKEGDRGKFGVQVGTGKDAEYSIEITGYGKFDPASPAGTLIIDRVMSICSNINSVAANAVATVQRNAKTIDTKVGA